MSGPKKPRAATPAAPATLTADQLRFAQLFAEIDDESQVGMMDMMVAMVKSCPRHVRPALRLVSGGAS